MNRTFLRGLQLPALLGLLVVAGWAAGCAAPEEPPLGADSPDLLAVYEDQEIHVADLDRFLLSLPRPLRSPPDSQRDAPELWLRDVLDELFVQKVLTRPEALAALEADAAFQQAWARQRRTAEAQHFLQLQEDRPTVSLDEVRAFYEENKASYSAPEKRLVHNLLLAFPEGATDEERDARCARAEELREQILAGASFEEMATRFSDSATAPMGGMVGEIARAQLRSDAADLIFGLTPGVVSQVLRNPAGCQLFLVVSVTPAVDNRFEVVSPRISERLATQKAGAWAEELARQVARDQGVELPAWPPEDFDPADGERVVLELHGQSFTTAQLLAMSGQGLPLGAVFAQLSRELLFSEALRARHPEEAETVAQAALPQLAYQWQRRQQLQAQANAVPEETLQAHYDSNQGRFQSDAQVEATIYSWPIQPGDPVRSLSLPRQFVAEVADGKSPSQAWESFSSQPGTGTTAVPLASLRELLERRPALSRALLGELEQGKVIGPFRAGPQLNVMVIDSYIEPRSMSFAEAYDQVLADYAADRSEQIVRSWLTSLSDQHGYRVAEANLAQFGTRLIERLTGPSEASEASEAGEASEPAP